MGVKWTASAHRDLIRLYEFLVVHNPRVAKKVVTRIFAESELLSTHPYIGTQLDEYAPRNVRSLYISDYELRYEVGVKDVYILRIWHTKESRLS